ncbi:uncharacterized protein LOC129905590 [Episyrphus balteatus]|uniref:uncharacterized protein LOC129905590 n=1 Tax=Episyrphus balteatus TaxID=286459 RepID=UPI002486A76C|nr:uncharacterized protein LOC129905590 [Episyrphus balteatus]
MIETGTSMGNPLSPLIAEVFMSSFETNLSERGLLPRIWFRYVDDVFAVIKRGEIDSVLNILNSEFDSINFTFESEEDKKLNFLDLTLSRKNGRIEFAIYRKPTTTNRYITNDSYSPIQHKLAAFHSMVHRLCKLPLSIANYTTEYNLLKDIAAINGYNPFIIDQLINKHTKKLKKSELTTLYKQNKQLHDNNNTERASMTYFPPITNKMHTKLKQQNIECVYSSNGKIKNMLGSTKDKSPIVNKSGIYEIKCGDCDAVYIGQTKRSIGVRFNEHSNHIKYNRPEKSSVAAHALTNNHFNVRLEDVKLKKHVTNNRRLDAYESLYISNNNNAMNSDNGNIMSPLFNLI